MAIKVLTKYLSILQSGLTECFRKYPHFHHGEKLSKYILHPPPQSVIIPHPTPVALTPPYLLMPQSPSNVELHQIFRGELIN